MGNSRATAVLKSFNPGGEILKFRGGAAPAGSTRSELEPAGAAPLLNGWCLRPDGESRLLQAIRESFEQARARRVAELAQSLRLDLADALARHVEVLADLFERVLLAVRAETVTELDDNLLARAERGEHSVRHLPQIRRHDRVGGADARLVLDEVTEVRVLLLADGRFQRDRLLRQLEDGAHLRDGHVNLDGDLLSRRLAPQLLDERAAGADELVDGLDHVHRDADRPSLVGDGARHSLTNPPGCIRREFITASPLELVHGLHQPDVPLLDEVEELQAAVRVLLGDGDDEPEVRFRQLALGFLRLVLARDNRLVGALDLDGRDAVLLLDLLEPAAGRADLPLEFLLGFRLDAPVLKLLGQLLGLALDAAHLLVRGGDGVNQALAGRLLQVEVL